MRGLSCGPYTFLMLCECGQREATVHEVVIRSGKKSERHLCEVCARQAGIGAPAPTQVSDLLGKLMAGQASAAKPKPVPAKPAAIAQAVSACPSCKSTFAEFKATGLLGCPECYRAFDTLLSPLLERAHEGGVHHVGKIPQAALERSRRAGEQASSTVLGTAIERAKRVEALRKALEDAVAGEQYERAARVRDELRQMGDHRETPT